jgi:hypothetical protein
LWNCSDTLGPGRRRAENHGLQVKHGHLERCRLGHGHLERCLLEHGHLEGRGREACLPEELGQAGTWVSPALGRTGDTSEARAEATEKRPRGQKNQGSWAELGTAMGNDLGVVTHRMRQSNEVDPRVSNPRTSCFLELSRSRRSFYRGVAGPGFRGYSLWYRSTISGECSRSDAGCQDGWSYPTQRTKYLRRRFLLNRRESRISSTSHSCWSSMMTGGGSGWEASWEGRGSEEACRQLNWRALSGRPFADGKPWVIPESRQQRERENSDVNVAPRLDGRP